VDLLVIVGIPIKRRTWREVDVILERVVDRFLDLVITVERVDLVIIPGAVDVRESFSLTMSPGCHRGLTADPGTVAARP